MTFHNPASKYYSCALQSNGLLSAYNTIYKSEPDSNVCILNDGDDLERAVFFDRLIKNLAGCKISAFNPFYDDSADGIYIENLKTYILSDGGYNKITPVIPGTWEKYISISEDKGYSPDLKKEILSRRAREHAHYKTACVSLKRASVIKEKAHLIISSFLDEGKTINFIRRFCGKNFRNAPKGRGLIRLLNSAAPLGIHTYYDTIFSMCEKTVDIHDDCGFVSSVILGIIKDCAVNEKIPFIMSPAYYSGLFPQFLLFPRLGTAVTVSDSNHILPFEPAKKIRASQFLKCDAPLEKIKILTDAENHLLEKSVLEIFAGREERFAYNSAVADYSNSDKAIISADKLCERLIP